MTREGVSGCGEGIQLQELMVLNVADWTAEEIAQLCRDAVASSTTDGAMEFINTTTPIGKTTWYFLLYFSLPKLPPSSIFMQTMEK